MRWTALSFYMTYQLGAFVCGFLLHGDIDGNRWVNCVIAVIIHIILYLIVDVIFKYRRSYLWVNTGASRRVFLTRKYAIKLPSTYSVNTFLYGMLGNRQEAEFWKVKDYQEKLCPVLLHCPVGFWLVMPRARIIDREEFEDILALGRSVSGKGTNLLKDWREVYVDGNKYKIPVELKPDSFGYLKGRLVAVDYGS